MPCLGTMNRGNPKRRRGGALQNLAEVRVTLADAPASWSAAALRRFRRERVRGYRTVHGKPPFVFFACIGTMNRVLKVAQTAQSAVSQVANLLDARRVRSLSFIPRCADWQSAILQAGSLRYEYGSWRASSTFVPCIGTVNLTVRQNLFGVPPSGGPNRPKPGHQTVGSWKANSWW